MALEDSAQYAYNAYRNSKGYRAKYGDVLPRWSELAQDEKDAWLVAAEGAVSVALDEQPTISGVSPDTWVENTTPEITITGTNLAGAEVDIDGLPCTSIVVNEADTEIVCNAPALTPDDTYDLTVTTYAGEAVDQVVITAEE